MNAGNNVQECLDDLLLLGLGGGLDRFDGSLSSKAKFLLVALSALKKLRKRRNTGGNKTNEHFECQSKCHLWNWADLNTNETVSSFHAQVGEPKKC